MDGDDTLLHKECGLVSVKPVSKIVLAKLLMSKILQSSLSYIL